MKFNPNVFFLARPPHLVVWNCDSHEQFELSEPYLKRLMELINDTSEFNETAVIDRSFLEAGIIHFSDRNEIVWGWDILSRIFHVGTKNLPLDSQPNDLTSWALQYTDHCDEILSKPYPIETFADSALHIRLPKPKHHLTDLTTALTARKTVRQFHDKPVELETLSTILYYSLAYLSEREDGEMENLPAEFRCRRSSPSGGGLNATEGYIYVHNVRSIAPGIYYYHPDKHCLEYRGALKSETLGSLLNGQHFVNNLQFGIFLTSRLDKLWWKYEHSRAYRMALIEIGHIAQTIQLLSTASGLNTWLTGALNENIIEDLIHLELQPGTEEVFFFVGAGYGAGKAIPAELKDEIVRRAKNAES